MTQKEYEIAILLIDRNAKTEVGYYDDHKIMRENEIKRLKEDLKILIDKEDEKHD